MRSHFTAALLAVGGLFGLATAAQAGTLEVTNDTSNYTGSYGGGEFKVVQFNSGPALAALGSGVGVSGGVFQTFCLEVTESMKFGQLLDFTTSTEAVGGGWGGGSPDPLDAKTAYLFTQFWNGALSGYDYTQGSGRTADATSLQLAIWKLEGEVDGLSSLETAYNSDTQAQTWVSAATSAVGSGAWSGLGNVLVLNLTQNGTNLQSVLAVTAIPLPPAVLLGLGLMTSLGGVGLIRRRQRRALA